MYSTEYRHVLVQTHLAALCVERPSLLRFIPLSGSTEHLSLMALYVLLLSWLPGVGYIRKLPCTVQFGLRTSRFRSYMPCPSPLPCSQSHMIYHVTKQVCVPLYSARLYLFCKTSPLIQHPMNLKVDRHIFSLNSDNSDH